MELIDRRSLTAKHFLNEDGTFRAEVSAQPIHYLKNGVYENIDTNFYVNNISDPVYYKFQTINNEFRLGLSENISVNRAIKFAYRYNGTGEIYNTFKHIALLDTSTNKKIIIQNPNNSIGIIENNKARYENVYDGINIEYYSLETKLKEFVYINDKSLIPDPSVYGMNLDATYIIFVNKIETDSMIPQYSDNNLHFIENNIKKIYVEKEWAKSALDKDIEVINHYDESTNEYYYGIPYNRFIVARLPITIDPTWTSTISEDANNYDIYFRSDNKFPTTEDAYIGTMTVTDNSNPKSPSSTYMQNNNYILKMNVNGLGLENALINSALIKLYIRYNSNLGATYVSTVNSYWDLNSSLASLNQIVSNDFKTDNRFNIIDSNYYYNFTLTTIINSWIKGITPNYGLLFRNSEMNNYDTSISFATLNFIDSNAKPQLVINYTIEKPAKPTITTTDSTITQVNISWQDNSSNESTFKIYHTTNPTAPNPANDVLLTTIPSVIEANSTSAVVTNLLPNTTYNIYVVSELSLTQSDVTATDVVTIQTKPLSPPNNIVGTVLSSSKINWTFDTYYEVIEYYLYKNSNKVAKIVKNGLVWRVYRYNGTTFETDIAEEHTTPQYLMSGLSANTPYVLKVSSRINNLESTQSNNSPVTTNSMPTVSGFTGTRTSLNNIQWKIDI